MNFIPCTDVYYSDDCEIGYAGPYSVQQLFEYVSPQPSPQHQPQAQPQQAQAQSMPHHDSWREQFYYRTKPYHQTLSNQQAYDDGSQYRYTWDVPLDQQQLYYPPLSPITPLDSPQYNYQPPNPTPTPTATTTTASSYLPAMQYYAYDQQLPLAPEMYHSPLYGSSCDSSPMFEPPTSYQNEQDDDEEEADEVDVCVLPDAGNKELRGMGLYDTPELIDSSCCPSPVTPGKGLVLERSFGLPKEMMVKDEVSGKVVKRQVELEEEEGWPVGYMDVWGQWP